MAPSGIQSLPAPSVVSGETPEELIGDLVDAVKQSQADVALLVDMLAERHRVYDGRGGNAVIRIRGYLLAAFEEIGLPDRALNYAIEELESGRDAYLVAAAAKALRGLDVREPRIAPFLFRAIANIKDVDDAVSFEAIRPHWPVENSTTGLIELFNTFAWLGGTAAAHLPRLEALGTSEMLSADARRALARAIESIRLGQDTDVAPASCCSLPEGGVRGTRSAVGHAAAARIALEDHDGAALTYGEYFADTPSIVVFFYTRCGNPNKCSLTMTKLAQLQSAIKEAGLSRTLKTAGITYDPAFDNGARMRAYAEARGVTLDDRNRLLRAPVGMDILRDYFELAVSYGPAAVNRHAIELFILDASGRPVGSASRLQWDVDEVLGAATALAAH